MRKSGRKREKQRARASLPARRAVLTRPLRDQSVQEASALAESANPVEREGSRNKFPLLHPYNQRTRSSALPQLRMEGAVYLDDLRSIYGGAQVRPREREAPSSRGGRAREKQRLLHRSSMATTRQCRCSRSSPPRVFRLCKPTVSSLPVPLPAPPALPSSLHSPASSHSNERSAESSLRLPGTGGKGGPPRRWSGCRRASLSSRFADLAS